MNSLSLSAHRLRNGVHRFLYVCLLAYVSTAAHAAIVVNGVTTKSYYAGSVTLSVPNEAGFTIVSQVDGIAIPPGVNYTEVRAGYHELFVTKTPSAGGAAETRTVQFIVRDSARTSSDTGVPSWVPLEAVDAPADVLDETSVVFVAPSRMSVGGPLPLVVRLMDAQGGIARLNATAVVSGPNGTASTFRIYRGAGSGVWTAPTSVGPLFLTLNIGDRAFTRQVQVEVAPNATLLQGTLSSSRSFDSGTDVAVTGDLTVPAGITLRFGAGSNVRVARDVTINVFGRVEVAGTLVHPVLFTRHNPTEAWGGFHFQGGASSADLNYGIFTGAGANQNWASGKGFSAHKPEQPVFAFDAGTTGGTCVAVLNDCYIVDNQLGQAGLGRNASVTFKRCLVQRTKSCGQYNGGDIHLLDSHIVEIPAADYTYVDADNDGFYLTAGAHELRNSIIGWAKDDGVDMGSGNSTSTAQVTNCWFESCFHEGMAWSERRIPTVTDTVSINNGQGIECGFSNADSPEAKPVVTGTNLLLVGNQIGARYGDNYDWTYDGWLTIRDSLILHNGTDVWGFEWNSWTYREDRMTIEDNLVTAPLARHPDNSVFSSTGHAARVATFLTSPAARRGFGVVRRPAQNARADYGGDVVVHLDRPATEPIALPWRVVAKGNFSGYGETVMSSGTLDFTAGMNSATLALPALPATTANAEWIAVIFENSDNAVATGSRGCHFVDLPEAQPNPPDVLIPFGSVWRYLDNGSNQGTGWRLPGFNDGTWSTGAGELGYGDDDEETPVGFIDIDPVATGVQRNATTYFRRTFTVSDLTRISGLDLLVRYDDAAVVYINGQRVAATAGTPSDPAYTFFIGGTAPADNSVLSASLPASALVNGTNTIAVEIHQQAATSSDISFDLELTAPAVAPPAKIYWEAGVIGRQMHVFWTTPGVIPQESSDLKDWQDRPDLTSPAEIHPSGPRGFLRLKLP